MPIFEDKQLQDIENLSQAIDRFNAGLPPASDDTETVTLLATAKLVKAAHEEPPASIGMLADAIAADVIEQARRKRRRWLWTGSVGTVAASLLVLALNMAPSTVIPQPGGPLPGNVTLESAQVSPPVAEKTDRQGVAANPDEGAKPPDPITPPKAPPTDRAEGDNRVAKADAREGTPRTAAPSVVMRSMAAVEPDKSPVLGIPGQKPDQVIRDAATGTIRQVYNAGSDREITVTQRSKGQQAATQAGPGITAAAVDKDKAVTKTNSVTVTVKGVEATVEGRLPQAELTKVAESLVEE